MTPPVPLDTDSDGMCDAMDDDIDGDTWPNTSELVCGTDPYNPLSMPSADTDSDGLCDDIDMDDDGDGIEDSMDAFPLDVQAWKTQMEMGRQTRHTNQSAATTRQMDLRAKT